MIRHSSDSDAPVTRPVLPDPLPDHPRLLATPADWTRLRAQVRSDDASRRLWTALVERADGLLTQPTLERVLSGKRLLLVSREALDRIAVLSLVANVSTDEKYAHRAVAEVLSVARFTDWNPSHFLDVAEMALAVAIGYDWVFRYLNAAERDEIATALADKALRVSLDASAKHNRWLFVAENWTQVCHGGLGAAAIAIADKEPELAETILARALEKLPVAAAFYAPDGAYPEGPMYWSYGTSYHVVLAAALLRLTGDTAGLDAYPGFAQSADYLTQVTTPTGRYFNYADCSHYRRLEPPLFWMAKRFGRSDWLSHDLTYLDLDLAAYRHEPLVQHGYYDMLSFALLWHEPARSPAVAAPPPRHWLGRGAMPIAVHRNTRGNLYLGIKGGSVGISHSHMDVGSFVLEADGVSWAVDPGMQDYVDLETAGVDLWNETEQSSQRWEVFRIGPEAHNILRFDGSPQRVAGSAQFIAFEAEGRSPLSILDLTPAYAGQVQSARRGVMLIGDGAMLIQDEWTDSSASTATWQFLTHAEIGITAPEIALRQDGRRLVLKILDAAGAVIAVDDLSAPARPYDAANPGLRRIRVTVPATAGLIRILAVPGSLDIAAPRLLPLGDWVAKL